MPLSDHEQRILEEIEQGLSRDDPKLAEQVSSTDLYSHATRRIRLASLGFVLGLVMLIFFAVSVWIAVAGFVLMVVSALLLSRYLGRLGRDQIRTMQQAGGFSITGIMGRIAGRIESPPPPPEEP